MSVYRKLQAARAEFLSMPIKKSGKNKFAGFEYFELSDFIPTVSKLFDMAGLCGVVRFTDAEATLTVYDADGDGSIVFTSPFVMAENAKGQAIQSLGSTHTYFRRYLWLLAMDIVEVDLVDAAAPAEPVKKVKPEPPKEPVKTEELVKIEGKDSPWQMKIEEKEGGNWVDGVKWAADTALTFALKPEDVTNIFKVNRNIFDKLKIEDPVVYDDLVVKFKEYKTNLIKE
jgi:hypothetical protein